MTRREQMTKDAEESEKAFKESINATVAKMHESDLQRQADLARRRKEFEAEFGHPLR